ncbi:MAG: RNA polymerase sigma-70 factor [Bacteroidales bacterium]|jgi:RNA polymerase sigma-70 factor (ECF subfamily)|nr:RNA polymerase sigma-70 factor [Bacteroidales bacterium]MCI2132966.1 RNA polymerase sigma-70 factor [Bacteroidales bacterium]
MKANRKDNTDSQLVSNIRKGDIKSFEILFERYYPVLFTFAIKMLKDRETADDITQECFIKFWLYRDRLNPELPVKRMLYKIVRNSCLDFFRSKKEVLQSLVSSLGTDFSDNAKTDEMISFYETNNILLRHISQLPEKRRAVFEMSRYLNMSNKDIAGRLNISERTVEKHIQLALGELRGKVS